MNFELVFNGEWLPLNYAVNIGYIVACFVAIHIVSLVPFARRSLTLLVVSIIIVFGMTGSLSLLAYYTLLTVVAFLFFKLCSLRNRFGIFAIVFFVINLCMIKYFPNVLAQMSPLFDDSLPLLGILGISFTTFKILDLMIEARRGRIKGISVLDLAAFVWFFPTFAQGPIQRSVPFMNDLGAEGPRWYELIEFKDVKRLCWGILKISFFSKFVWIICPLNPLVQDMVSEGIGFWQGLLSLYALYLYIYLEFSGISDIAIVIARLLGFKIPENFDYPFLARTPQEFWARWHMSLTSWCQDHIFFNLYKINMRWFRGYGEWFIMILPVFVTFIVIGLWHGNTMIWLYYGLFHSVGVYLTIVMKRPFLTFFDKIEGNTKFFSMVLGFVGQVFTFTFVSVSLICVLPRDIFTAFLSLLSGNLL